MPSSAARSRLPPLLPPPAPTCAPAPLCYARLSSPEFLCASQFHWIPLRVSVPLDFSSQRLQGRLQGRLQWMHSHSAATADRQSPALSPVSSTVARSHAGAHVSNHLCSGSGAVGGCLGGGGVNPQLRRKLRRGLVLRQEVRQKARAVANIHPAKASLRCSFRGVFTMVAVRLLTGIRALCTMLWNTMTYSSIN